MTPAIALTDFSDYDQGLLTRLTATGNPQTADGPDVTRINAMIVAGQADVERYTGPLNTTCTDGMKAIIKRFVIWRAKIDAGNPDAVSQAERDVRREDVNYLNQIQKGQIELPEEAPVSGARMVSKSTPRGWDRETGGGLDQF